MVGTQKLIEKSQQDSRADPAGHFGEFDAGDQLAADDPSDEYDRQLVESICRCKFHNSLADKGFEFGGL